MQEERQRRWKAHCHRMAEATQALADWCEDLDMMRAYVELAAKWITMADQPPPGSGLDPDGRGGEGPR